MVCHKWRFRSTGMPGYGIPALSLFIVHSTIDRYTIFMTFPVVTRRGVLLKYEKTVDFVSFLNIYLSMFFLHFILFKSC